MSIMIVLAQAKINLFLRILGTLPNGYHEIQSLIARVSLADVISLDLPPEGDAQSDRRGKDRRLSDRRNSERRNSDRRSLDRRFDDRRTDDRREEETRQGFDRRKGLDRRKLATPPEALPFPDRRSADRRLGQRRAQERRQGGDRRQGERRLSEEGPNRRREERRSTVESRRVNSRRSGLDRRYPTGVQAAPRDFISVEAQAPGGEEEALAGPANLCLRALTLFRESTGYPKGPVRIRLTKRIPVAAGLGGGSSNAAAVLKALNSRLPKPMSPKNLAALGTKLGSDVAFFLADQPTLLARGTGEKLAPYEGEPLLPYALLVNAGDGLSTADVYDKYELTKGAPGTNLKPAANQPCPLGYNDLYPAASSMSPSLAVARDDLERAAMGSPIGMSGSGPTLWALFYTLALAQKAQASLRKSGNYWSGVYSIV
jgi:4-diphosphocytidyl-2-C-methyl-D-erythritol kinase